jgi:Cys-tRNA(Pro)/Cys-tRNA(Cys) deacylase
MSGRITPAVRAMEQIGAIFQLLEYDYDPSADEIGLQAARALGRRPSTVFKTLVVALDSGELVCAIIPSNARLTLKAIASAAGARKAELSDPKKAERTTGYVVGGISALGQRKRLRTFIDASALSLEEIVVNGGRRGLQIVLRPADLILATSAVVVSLVPTTHTSGEVCPTE